MLYLVTFVVGFRILEFFYRTKSVHRPVCKLPSFRPTNVHIFSADYNNNEVNPIEAYTRTEAGSRRWSNSRLYPINASLSQHQVSIVPFVSPFVSVCVLLHTEELCSYEFFKLRNLHSRSANPCNIKRSCLIIIIC